MKTSYLFIGGIADGEWFFVPDAVTTWGVEVNTPRPAHVRQGEQMYLNIQRMYYRRKAVTDLDKLGQRVVNFVFIPEDDDTLIIQRLIEHYNPRTQGN